MTLDPTNARDRFAEILNLADDQISLAEAALCIAAEEYPRLDVSLYLERLSDFAELASERVANQFETASGPGRIIQALNDTLFDDLGFHGNRDNYYDPRNSYLNEVIDRRAGIPITLSVVYIDVATRIGFPVEGVNLPGHFIVSHTAESGVIYIDAFNNGRLLGVAGCDELLKEVTGGRAELTAEHLAPATARQILARMLSNLLSIYSKGDHRRALGVIDLMLMITPDSPPHLRDRGLLLASLGNTHGAIDELEKYLALVPDAPDANLIQEQIKLIKQKQARWN
jgi:regulator of sirC expression with transglutaminase-like and TPR domain